MAIYRIPTRYEWLTLESLSPNDWLVVDRDQERLTGDGVIGHIQSLLGVFETLQRSEPLERGFFDTLDSAIESFAPFSEAELSSSRTSLPAEGQSAA